MTVPRDTIFALSSGRPPAAIAVVRISGPRAGDFSWSGRLRLRLTLPYIRYAGLKGLTAGIAPAFARGAS